MLIYPHFGWKGRTLKSGRKAIHREIDLEQPDHRNLSRRERQIMDVIYGHGRATALEVMDRIPDPPGYSTVRTLLGVLERKGFLRHERKSYHYVYFPTAPASEVRSNALEHLMETFFDGSATRVVSALMDLRRDELGSREFAEIQALIEKSKKQGR